MIDSLSGDYEAKNWNNRSDAKVFIEEYVSLLIGLHDYFRYMENELSKGNQVFEKRLDATKRAYITATRRIRRVLKIDSRKVGAMDKFLNVINNLSPDKVEGLRKGLYRYIIQYPQNRMPIERHRNVESPNPVDIAKLINEIFGDISYEKVASKIS